MLYGKGLQPPAPVVQEYINRTGSAVVRGQICQVDVAQSGSGVTNNIPGEDSSGLRSLVTPAAGQLKFGKFAMVMANAPAGARVQAATEGVFENIITIVQAVTGDVAAGSYLVPIASGSNLDADLANGEKVIGLVLETTTSVGSGGKKAASVWFNGDRGFGNYLA